MIHIYRVRPIEDQPGWPENDNEPKAAARSCWEVFLALCYMGVATVLGIAVLKSILTLVEVL